ncbi:ATP-binding protein [Leptolyngbyaceae cyanobacterium UHCC 1019]
MNATQKLPTNFADGDFVCVDEFEAIRATPRQVNALNTQAQFPSHRLESSVPFCLECASAIDASKKQMQYQAFVNQLTLSIRSATNLNAILQLATDGTTQALQVQRGVLLRLKYWEPPLRNTLSEQMPKVWATVTCDCSLQNNLTQGSNLIQSNGDEALSDKELQFEKLSDLPAIAQNLLPQLHDSFWLSDYDFFNQAFLDSPQVTALDHQSTHTFGQQAFPSLLIAPLESQGTVLGFLVFQASPDYVWQSEQIEFVELVSAQVSTAIMQTETLRQVQSLVEKRTAELKHSLAIQAKLYERSRQQVEQLRHLNTLKDEFLDTMSHELRTPLTSMSLAIRMLRQTGLASDRSSQYLDILEQQCQQETNLINDLLALRELESHQTVMQLEEFNLMTLVNELTEGIVPKWVANRITLQIEKPQHSVKIRSDRDSLSRILQELLTNAGKHSVPNSQVCLKISIQRQAFADQISISLTNTGTKISAEELPYIFDKFRRCAGATQNVVQGTGLGLALVRSLVQHLNGTIAATSFPTANDALWETCFTLTLPQFLEVVKLS